jgi:uncharacterized Zn finger protein (UPF0148 family)
LPAVLVIPAVAGLVQAALLATLASEWVAIAAYWGILLSFLVVFIGLICFVLARAAIHCPHCRASLEQQPGLAIATRNCGSCGRRVLGEPGGSNATPWLTREELDQIALAYVKRDNWLTLAVIGATIACLGAYAALRDRVVAWLGAYLTELAAELWSLSLPAAAAIVILCLYLRHSRRLRSDPRAGCPHCGRSLLLRRDRAGANCGYCGRKAVIDATAAPAADPAPLRDFEEFRAASAYYHGRGAAKTIALALGSPAVGALLSLATVVLSGLDDNATAAGLTSPARVALGIAIFTPFALGFAGFFVVLVRLERRTAADVRLRCPACGNVLVQSHSSVIATRSCPKCRRRVLAEPAAG